VPLQIAIWLGLLGATLPLIFQLKPVPALALSFFPLLPWALPLRLRRTALWLVLSLWGALALASALIALALWWFPAQTPDGHPVMPIGQVLLGGTFGAVLGVALLGRATPREPVDVMRMARLVALATPLFLGATALDHC
jgi:hypothetical protein